MLTAKDIFVVGVAGGSGSGKTTLTENLVQRFSDHICVVHHDNYYKPHDDLPFEVRTKLNYDCPDAFETPLLAQQLRQLRQGQPVDCPTYDYANHTRAKGTVRLVPQPVILLEGILLRNVRRGFCVGYRPHSRRWRSMRPMIRSNATEFRPPWGMMMSALPLDGSTYFSCMGLTVSCHWSMTLRTLRPRSSRSRSIRRARRTSASVSTNTFKSISAHSSGSAKMRSFQRSTL